VFGGLAGRGPALGPHAHIAPSAVGPERRIPLRGCARSWLGGCSQHAGQPERARALCGSLRADCGHRARPSRGESCTGLRLTPFSPSHGSLLVAADLACRGVAGSTAVSCLELPCLVRLALPFVSAYGDTGLGLLGDPTRRVIFELLARRPSSVQELADQLPISRPAVSQHLRILRDGGLVISQAEGTRRIYRLNPDGVGALRTWLDGVWGDALAGFQKAAEASSRLDRDVSPNQED
jgi:DNA-binding transcriptional ArsR family regulator